MDLQDIKIRIFKDEDGWNNYMNVSIEEMDWLVEQAEKVERHEKTIDELEESLHIARASRRDLLASYKQLKKEYEISCGKEGEK